MKMILFAIAATGFLSPLLPAESVEKKPSIRNVSPDQAEKLVKEVPGLIILDVRTPEEFEQGHIKGAVNIDFFDSDFEKKARILDPTKPVLVHCASGNRSSQAVDMLRQFRRTPAIYHLKDGFTAWKTAKKPVDVGK